MSRTHNKHLSQYGIYYQNHYFLSFSFSFLYFNHLVFCHGIPKLTRNINMELETERKKEKNKNKKT